MKGKKLFGVIVPIVTPVNNEDEVDEVSFRGIINYLKEAKVNGIFVGGSAGEGPLLTLKEWIRMMKIAYDELQGEMLLLGGVMDTSTKRIIEKIKILMEIGYKVFVLTPTFYTSLKTSEEFIRLYGTCKEKCDKMEMVAYNIPSCTGSQIPVNTIIEMAKRGWIKYCKESSGDINYFKNLINQGNNVGLKILMGDESLIAEGLQLGACGIVPVCANYEPKTFISAYQAALSNNFNQLMLMQQRIMFLREHIPFAGTCWISGVKYAVSSLGIGSGKPVSPLQPLSLEQKKNIKKIKHIDFNK